MSTALTLSEAVHLSSLIEATVHGRRVMWLTEHGDTLEGTARCFAHDGGGLWFDSDGDVRDARLHVSGMFEHWLPVRDVLDQMRAQTFVVLPAPKPTDVPRGTLRQEVGELMESGLSRREAEWAVRTGADRNPVAEAIEPYVHPLAAAVAPDVEAWRAQHQDGVDDLTALLALVVEDEPVMCDHGYPEATCGYCIGEDAAWQRQADDAGRRF